MNSETKIRFYFSFRSPFAAIAFNRMSRAIEFQNVEIELMPVWPETIFGGHMDNPTDNIFKMAYIFSDAARQAEVAGLDATHLRSMAALFVLPEESDYKTSKVGFTMPEEKWEIPHAAFVLANQLNLGWEFGNAVFSRRFGFDGNPIKDVMDANVVREIAGEIGLDQEQAATAYQSEHFNQVIHQCTKDGERDGVFGVPFFVLEKDGVSEKFWGNDHIEYLLRSLIDSKTLPQITVLPS